jgi:tyrosine-protein kinase Etk/Wzc
VDLLLEAVPGREIPTGETPAYSFTILSDGAVNSYLDRNLDVTVVNPNANTIQISFTDNNAAKAAHIVNNIDTVYLREKLASKKESSDSTLRYINRIIAENDQRLRQAEEDQTAFVRRSKTYDAKADINGLKDRLEQQQLAREKLAQNLRLLEDVQQMVARGQLTHSDKEKVTDNLPGLSDINDPLLAGMLNDLDAQQLELRLTLLSQTDKTLAVQRAQTRIREAQETLERQLSRDQALVRQQLARLDKLDAELNSRLMAMPDLATQQDRLKRPLERQYLFAATQSKADIWYPAGWYYG